MSLKNTKANIPADPARAVSIAKNDCLLKYPIKRVLINPEMRPANE